LAKGLWRISIAASLVANYSNVGGGGCISLGLRHPADAGNSNNIMAIAAAGTAAQPQGVTYFSVNDYLLPKDGHEIYYAVQANAVGEINHGQYTIVLSKLI